MQLHRLLGLAVFAFSATLLADEANDTAPILCSACEKRVQPDPHPQQLELAK